MNWLTLVALILGVIAISILARILSTLTAIWHIMSEATRRK